jgi:hypothetical protein
MAFFICRSSFFRTTALLWLFVSLASQMLDTPRGISATQNPSAPQATNPSPARSVSQAIRDLQSNQEPQQITLSEKQKRDLMKANFEKMKRDAKELADLAKSLQEQLNKSNENILSLNVVDKADKIEKLARKIKGTARGF